MKTLPRAALGGNFTPFRDKVQPQDFGGDNLAWDTQKLPLGGLA